MSKTTTAWFFEDPMDLEYKNYKLLANVEYAENCLNEGKIHDAMDFIEDHLVCFYRFQTDQEIRGMNNTEIVGVDPIMMDLIYKKGQKDNSEDIKILSDIAERGILEFEALHSLFRIKWRAIEDAIKMSYVGERPGILSNGYIFLLCENGNWIRQYEFKNPKNVREWKHFKLNFIKEIKYNKEEVIDIVEILKSKYEDYIFLVAGLSKSFDSIHAIDHVFQCRLYYKLQKDYIF